MESLLKALEKFMAGTVARGLLWVFAFLAARTGTEAPGEDVATKTGAWVAALVICGIALAWSYAKNKIWKESEPE